jgi:hypothetical protein
VTDNRPHATVFDLPGWPCPPRVRDIPKHEESWGWVSADGFARPFAVAQDELGRLWVNGDAIPQFRTPEDSHSSPGALVFHAASGIGLWVHQKSLQYLPSISQLEMRPDEWLPVNEVAAEWPPFIKRA